MDGRELFTCEPASLPEVRHWVDQWCLAQGRADRMDPLRLVVSEFTTHVMEHGRGPIEIHLEHRGDRIFGVVRDHLPLSTTRLRGDAAAEFRHQILDHLADWTVTRDELGGVIRFELLER